MSPAEAKIAGCLIELIGLRSSWVGTRVQLGYHAGVHTKRIISEATGRLQARGLLQVNPKGGTSCEYAWTFLPGTKSVPTEATKAGTPGTLSDQTQKVYPVQKVYLVRKKVPPDGSPSSPPITPLLSPPLPPPKNCANGVNSEPCVPSGKTKAKGGHREVIEHFSARFRGMFGEEYPFSGGKDGKIVSGLLGIYSKDRMIELIDLFFDSKNTFLKGKPRSIGMFKAMIPSLLAEAPPEDPDDTEEARRFWTNYVVSPEFKRECELSLKNKDKIIAELKALGAKNVECNTYDEVLKLHGH